MVLLIDTNIIIDVILQREPFFEASYAIHQKCQRKEVEGYLAAHTITNFFYSTRKDLSTDERRNIVANLLKVFKVVPLDDKKFAAAVQKYEFKDFEDCLQAECAKSIDADYIITRDKNDFKLSEVPAIEPEEFFEMFKDEETEEDSK